MQRKKIVCLGGGNALPKVILQHLKTYPVDIVSVTSMADNGGSTGVLREKLGVMPPGDLRRHILAFSDAQEWKKNLWEFRFSSDKIVGDYVGHSLGNLLLAGLEKTSTDYMQLWGKVSDFMEIDARFQALPATVDDFVLGAKLSDGQIIVGETVIDVVDKRPTQGVVREIFAVNPVFMYEPLKKIITEADLLLLGPGDLYSSLLPCFLPQGMKEVVSQSLAPKVLVCNIMNKKGETDGFVVQDFVREVEKCLGCVLSKIFYNQQIINEECLKNILTQHPQFSDQVVLAEKVDDRFVGGDWVDLATGDHKGAQLVGVVYEQCIV